MSNVAKLALLAGAVVVAEVLVYFLAPDWGGVGVAAVGLGFGIAHIVSVRTRGRAVLPFFPDRPT